MLASCPKSSTRVKTACFTLDSSSLAVLFSGEAGKEAGKEGVLGEYGTRLWLVGSFSSVSMMITFQGGVLSVVDSTAGDAGSLRGQSSRLILVHAISPSDILTAVWRSSRRSSSLSMLSRSGTNQTAPNRLLG